MAAKIHPTAVIDPCATIDDHVVIGPYCVIEGGAFIGAGTELKNHVTIMGDVRIGTENVIYPNTVIGAEPQDLAYHGERTWVVIGDRNVIREGVTIHRATTKENGITRIGSDNYMMAGCHVAHDCVLGSHIYMANLTTLAGHVRVYDHASMSGLIGVHHYCTIGQYSFVGGMTRLVTDVPPYMLVEGHPSVVRCVNLVGLRRRGFSVEDIRSLQEAHRLLYRHKMGTERAYRELNEHNAISGPVQQLFDFLKTQHSGKRGRGLEGKRAA